MRHFAREILNFLQNLLDYRLPVGAGHCGVVSVGPRLSGAKLGCEQCLPLRGKQPHERVCAANWRRSLCAAKRPRTPAKVNDCCFRDDLHFTSLPCRGRACPARSLPPYPFYDSIRRGGIHPSRAPSHRRKRPRRPEGWPPYTPTSNLCVGRGALTPPPLFPSRTPAVFAYSLQTLPFPHKTGDIFAKALPRLYRTMVDTRKKRRYNRVVPMRTHPKHYTKNNIGEKGEYFT